MFAFDRAPLCLWSAPCAARRYDAARRRGRNGAEAVLQEMSPAAVPAFFWKVDGVGVSVAVSATVLAGLRASLDQAPADTEFGGILLGSFAPDGDGYRTQVDAFEAFPIEHRHGQNYRLSARDHRFLEQRLKRLRRKGFRPVGFCRSHNRRGLYLDQRDFDLFRTDFRHPATIFLLVRGQDATNAKGAVFVWEEDDIRRHASYLEFPLPEPLTTPSPERAHVAPSLASQSQELAHAGLAWALKAGADVADIARRAASGLTDFARAGASGLPYRARTGPNTAHLAANVGQVVNLRPIVNRPADAVRALAPKPDTGPAIAARLAQGRASGAAAVARLRAFPSFPPATPAKVLVTIALPLISFYTAREIALQRARGPEADQVRPAPQPVRLAIPQIDRDVASAPVPAQEAKPLPFPDTSPSVTPAGQTIPGPPVKARRTPISNSRDRRDSDSESSSAAKRPSAPPTRIAPALLDPPPVLLARPLPALPRVVASPPVADRPEAVVAYFKPAQPSSIRQAFQKVFTGHSAGDGFVAASPVEQPLPSLPPDAVPLEEGASVEMQAKVDRLGNVVNVKVVEGNRQLADASADALFRWRFDPARRNGAPVESAMRIRFEFRNPSR